MHLHQRALFYYSIVAVLLGAQFMAIGFLGRTDYRPPGKGPQAIQYPSASRGDAAEASGLDWSAEGLVNDGRLVARVACHGHNDFRENDWLPMSSPHQDSLTTAVAGPCGC